MSKLRILSIKTQTQQDLKQTTNWKALATLNTSKMLVVVYIKNSPSLSKEYQTTNK